MLHDVCLPIFTSTYRRVIKVLVDVGDEVRLDTDVLEIETEMATVWFPSTRKGIIMRVYVHPGQYLEFGQPILQVQVNPHLPDLRTESV